MIATSAIYPAEEVLEPIRVTDDRNNLLGMLFDGLSDPNATPMFREPIMCAKARPSPCGGQQCDSTRRDRPTLSRHTRESGPPDTLRDPGSWTPVRSFVRGVVLVNIHSSHSEPWRARAAGTGAHSARTAGPRGDHARRNGNARASGSRALSVGPLAPRSRLAPTRCDADGRTGQSAGRSECASSVARSRSQRSPSRLEALYA